MIYAAGDHHAEPVLAGIRRYLEAAGREFREFGYQGGKEPAASLQEFIPQVADAVLGGPDNSGILVCGTGAGVEIGANRFAGIRASLCNTPQAAEWARVYDKANVLCIASWNLDNLDLPAILDSWYSAEYDGDEGRLEMFRAFDSWSRRE